MPLTTEEAFKTGFLLRCAHEGLDQDTIHKRAAEAFEKCAGPVQAAADLALAPFRLGTSATIAGSKLTANTLLKLLLAAPAAGAVVGAGTGYLGATMRNQFDPAINVPDASPDVKAVHHAELVEALRREAAQARHRTKILRRKRRAEGAKGRTRYRNI